MNNIEIDDWYVVETIEEKVMRLENENKILNELIVLLNKKLELKQQMEKNKKYKSSNGF